ncbi:MAG: hypothetical protein JWN24_115 [Phycisphaerales bacterium]|nr:hypothetical protein [Phycisphaerales bacterium]
MRITHYVVATAILLCAANVSAAEIFVRAKLPNTTGDHFKLTIGGFRHAGDPWQFPGASVEAAAGEWSPWVDVSKWPWHGKVNREGGIAEWPSMTIGAERNEAAGVKRDRTIEVELADAPDEGHVVHHFTESSESNTIGFLVPNPLREHAKEFETGSQMAARHLAWAKQATGGIAIHLKQFDVCTSLWGPYDPALARQEIDVLRQLGFNVIGGADSDLITSVGARIYRQSGLYNADPEKSDRDWKAGEGRRVENAMKTEEGRKELSAVAHWVLADEIRTLDLQGVDAAKRDGWFRAYLRESGVTDQRLGAPVEEARYPGNLLHQAALPRDADLRERKLAYYAAKFGQQWSARQLRHSTDLIHGSAPGMKTETLPTDHGFFNAWGPPHIGMSASMLDLFEVASRQSVDQLSAEDWLGLNHMYGPAYTWTGAQSFEYLTAIMRSAIGQRPILLRGLITPGDDNYLRLKAYSALGQGTKSFFFWTYGPTFIGTENYWSDLQSQYDGIAKLGKAMEQAEPILYPARPVRDPVAVLYSVSHDIWHSDDPAAFVEKRLLWHALRHLHVQPDFLREEDVSGGALSAFKVLYVTDECVSRSASAQIDKWVRDGGVVYLSAGAATRDEFFESFVPPFAQRAWPDDAAKRMKSEKHAYNERVDLPTIPAMARARGEIGGKHFDLPVIGCRLDLRAGVADPIAKFDDGVPAMAAISHGKGQVIAAGFMPMLAYGQLAGFKPATLEETWPTEPRLIAQLPLDRAGVTPVARASEPVVETSLLTGPKGSALVLVNYTYHPVHPLTVELRLPAPVSKAVSTSGAKVRLERIDGGARLELPLEWTDVVLLSP